MSPTTPVPEFPPINTSVASINTFGCPCRQSSNHTPVASAPAFDDGLEVQKESIIFWILGLWFLASFIGVKLAEAWYTRPRRPDYGLWGLVVLAAAGLFKTVAAEPITAPIPTVTNLGNERQMLSGYPLTPIPTVENCGFRSAAPSTGLPLRYIAPVGLIMTLIAASTVTVKYAALNYRDSQNQRQTDIAEAYHDKYAGLEESQATIEDASQSVFAPRQPKRTSAGATRLAILLVSLIVMAFLVPAVLASPTGTSATTATASIVLITSPAMLNGSNGTWWMTKDKPQSWFVNAGSRSTISLPLATAAVAVDVVSFAGRLRRAAAPTRRTALVGRNVTISAQGRRSVAKALAFIVAALTVLALLPVARVAGTSYRISNATLEQHPSCYRMYGPSCGSASLQSANLVALVCTLIGVALLRNMPLGRGIFAAMLLGFGCLIPLALAESIGDLRPIVNITDLTNGTTGDSLTWVPAAVSDAIMLSLSWPTIALGLVTISIVWATLTGHGIFAALILTLASLLPLTFAQANGPVTIYVPSGPGSQSGGGVSNPHRNTGLPRAEFSRLAVAVLVLCLANTVKGSISLPGILESEGMTATGTGAAPSRTTPAQVTITLPTSAASRNEPFDLSLAGSGRTRGFIKKLSLSLAVVCLLAFMVPSASAQRTSETSGVTVMVGPPMQHTRPTQGPIPARGAPQTPPPAYTATYVDAANATTTLTINREALDGINFRLRSQGQRTILGPVQVDWASLTAALWGFAAGVALILGMLV
nr:hypothetical protein B0A51_15863 [Rachicladosporium sp. CCFEE 5018]